jgi:hypothetical protein
MQTVVSTRTPIRFVERMFFGPATAGNAGRPARPAPIAADRFRKSRRPIFFMFNSQPRGADTHPLRRVYR